jgi:hypothetical protein
MGLLDEVQVILDRAEDAPLVERSSKITATAEGYSQEVIDPIAAAKLRELPGSFRDQSPAAPHMRRTYRYAPAPQFNALRFPRRSRVLRQWA